MIKFAGNNTYLMRFTLCLIVILLFTIHLVFAQSTQLVRIDLRGKDLTELAKQGLALDHGEVYPGRFAYFNLLPDEVALIKKCGWDYSVVTPDDIEMLHPRDYPCEQSPINSHPVPHHFRYGSMGGYFTYSEMNAILDSMHLLYPNLISQRIQIDTFQTIEGRKMEFLRMSNNPDVDQDKPTMLFTALHHAREPISMSQLIMFMWYLLENYDSNPQVKQLLDNSEFYFIPCVNPDGYVINQQSNPNGGGYWRKNRWKDENDIICGVDINRNYSQYWGYNDVGSSPNKNSNTFRGPSPFSEPEAKAIKYLSEQQKFGLVLNYHSYGNDLIHPYGHIKELCPDDKQFKNIGSLFLESNNYTIGTSYETLGYFVNGDSDDWQYEGIPGHKCYSFTPEIGTTADGFWPDKSKIIPLCQGVQMSNYQFIKMVHGYFRIQILSNTFITGKNENTIPLVARKYGIKDGPTSFTARVISGNASLRNEPHIFNIQTAEVFYDSLYVKPDPGIQMGDKIRIEFTNDMNGFTELDTFTFTYSPSLISYSDDAGKDGRIKSNYWGRDENVFFSPDYSYTDSPGGNYGNNTNAVMVLDSSFSITDSTDTYLYFKAKWEIENVFDYAQVFAISDGDTIPLCGKYTKAGGIFQKQDEPIYEGTRDWVSELINLNDFKGKTIQIGFSMVSDSLISKDGIYVDDISIFTPSKTPAKNNKIKGISAKVYPNPATSNSSLVLDSPEAISKIYILNLNGQRILYKSPGQQKFELKLPALSPGVYIIKMITENDNFICQKLIIH